MKKLHARLSSSLTGPLVLRHLVGPARYREQFGRLRVAHLTDIHVGLVTPLEAQHAAVELVNAQEPDVVLVTGDFVCRSQRYLDELTWLMSQLKAPTLAVLGNHDHWCGADEVRWALRRAGVEVLDNVHTTLTLRGQPLQVVGLDDAYTGHADQEAALKGLRLDLPSIGLSHIGEEADGLWARGVPLVLAGHTHAGQITVAKLHELALGVVAGHRYVHGLYGGRRPGSAGALYVGAGVGAAVMPVRLGERARREVTVFELGHEAPLEDGASEQIPLPGRKPSAELTARRRAAVERGKARRAARAR